MPEETEEQYYARKDKEALEDARLAAELEMKTEEERAAIIASRLSKGEAGPAPMAAPPPQPAPRPPVVAPPQMPPLPAETPISQGKGYMGPMITQSQFEQLPENTITNRAGPQRPMVLPPEGQQAQIRNMARATGGATFPGLTSRDPTEERFAVNALINRRIADGMPREEAVREAMIMHGPQLFGAGAVQKPMTEDQRARNQLGRDALASRQAEIDRKAKIVPPEKPVISPGTSYEKTDAGWTRIGGEPPPKLGAVETAAIKRLDKALGEKEKELSNLRADGASRDEIAAAAAEVSTIQSKLDKYKTSAPSPAAEIVPQTFARPPLLQGPAQPGNRYQVGKRYGNLIYLGGNPQLKSSWKDK